MNKVSEEEKQYKEVEEQLRILETKKEKGEITMVEYFTSVWFWIGFLQPESNKYSKRFININS